MTENASLVTLVSFLALGAAYITYGRFMARRVFRLQGERPTPAHTKEDGVDFVPTRVPVLFGHHFASIAGLGPILGPAIAVIWGWLPAVLWVVLGSILLGAVHDLGALTVSLRYRGRSIGDVCQDLIGGRARIIFLLIIFFLMSLAMGAFVNAIAGLFVSFNPDAIIPSLGLMLVAMTVGLAVYKLGVGLGGATIVGLAAFAGLIVWGVERPVRTYEWAAAAETRELLAAGRQVAPSSGEARIEAPYGAAAATAYLEATGNETAAADLKVSTETARRTWIWTLLGYGFVASVLPVWLLLQPRDYINSFQLYVALTLMFGGLAVAGITGAEENRINAPLVRQAADFTTAEQAPPPMVPMLFVTIACGAISGFHSLVSSGTTVRQLNRETDALPVGYGAMLTEGALAVLVIMACVAGLGVEAWRAGGAYSSWQGIGSGGLAVQLNAVVRGGANFLALLGVPVKFGMAFLAVTVVAFALTTLDSATRLLRFNVEELCRSAGLTKLANRYFASAVAVLGIASFGLSEGGKTLWVMFGTSNQLLAGLTLLTVSLFLFKLGRPIVYTLLPMAAMLAMTAWAMVFNLQKFVAEKNTLLVGTSVVVLGLTAWLVVEAVLSFARGRSPLNFSDDDLHRFTRREHERDEAAASAHLG